MTPDLARRLAEDSKEAGDISQRRETRSSPEYCESDDSPGISRSPNAFAALSESFQESDEDLEEEEVV